MVTVYEFDAGMPGKKTCPQELVDAEALLGPLRVTVALEIGPLVPDTETRSECEGAVMRVRDAVAASAGATVTVDGHCSEMA